MFNMAYKYFSLICQRFSISEKRERYHRRVNKLQFVWYRGKAARIFWTDIIKIPLCSKKTHFDLLHFCLARQILELWDHKNQRNSVQLSLSLGKSPISTFLQAKIIQKLQTKIAPFSKICLTTLPHGERIVENKFNWFPFFLWRNH